TRTILIISSHRACTASYVVLFGKIFSAQASVGIEITDHVTRTFMVYSLNVFNATPDALLALATRSESIPCNKSGSVACIETKATQSSAKSSIICTRHEGK